MSKRREVPVPSSYTEKLLMKELVNSERQIQKLIESYALCEQRWQTMTLDDVKQAKSGISSENSSKRQGDQIQSSKEIEVLRSLMRRLRRWRSGSQNFSYDNIRKLEGSLSAANDKFFLFSLHRLHTHRAYFLLAQPRGSNFDVDDDWSDLQARVSCCLQKGVSLHKVPNIESDLERIWTQLLQLKNSVRVTAEQEEKQVPHRQSAFTLARLNESNQDHQELINSLLKYVSKIKRIVDALKSGSHTLELLQDKDQKQAAISKLQTNGEKPKKTVRFKMDISGTDQELDGLPTGLTADECAEKDIEILLSYLSKFQRWLSGQELYTKNGFDRMSRSVEVIETEHLVKGVDLSRGSFFLSDILVMSQEIDSEYGENESELYCSFDSETRSGRRSTSCRLSASGGNSDDVLKMKLVVKNKIALNSSTKSFSDDFENLIDERLV